MSLDLIKQLREKTGAGIMDCKRALTEAKGDLDKAIQILKERGLEIALKKAQREVKEGCIEAYVHLGNKLGVLVEINCETDFVAKNELFRKLARDIAMQVAAAEPIYIRVEDIPQEVIEKEREMVANQLAGKPQQVIEKSCKEHLDQFYRCRCLLEQPFIKDEKITVKDYLNSIIAKFGENIQIRRFIRYQLGEEI